MTCFFMSFSYGLIFHAYFQVKNQNSYNENAVKILKVVYELSRVEGCSEPYQTSTMECFHRNS